MEIDNWIRTFFDSLYDGILIIDKFETVKYIFKMNDALGGGVTRSLALDKHGKSLSSYLLDIEI